MAFKHKSVCSQGERGGYISERGRIVCVLVCVCVHPTITPLNHTLAQVHTHTHTQRKRERERERERETHTHNHTHRAYFLKTCMVPGSRPAIVKCVCVSLFHSLSLSVCVCKLISVKV